MLNRLVFGDTISVNHLILFILVAVHVLHLLRMCPEHLILLFSLHLIRLHVSHL
jgi:hypothetical protein